MVARREITLEAGWNKKPVSAGQPGPSTNIYTYINLKEMQHNQCPTDIEYLPGPSTNINTYINLKKMHYNRPRVSHNNISPVPANFEGIC